MSFILDALKKSETERQQQTGAEFSNVPTGSGGQQSLKWLWILAALLGVNFAVLLGILLRPDTPPQAPPVVEVPAAATGEMPAAAAAEPSFEEQVAEARQQQAAREQAARNDVTVPASAQPIAVAAPETTTIPAVQRPVAMRVPTIDELRLNGSLLLSDLHLDIHVYSDIPDERFVFINMAKHREGSQLDEGPVVNEITPDGVILAYQGMTFLLPRE